MVRYPRPALPSLLALLLLVSCGGGGGGGGNSANASSNANTSIASLEPTAPAATGDTAVDGLNWFNFRRQQIGLGSAITRNSTVDVAALGHSNYQTMWGIDHYQTEGRTGFTGACIYDNDQDARCPSSKVSRLEAANFQFTSGAGYAYGEVISKTSSASGYDAAEGLIGAIYHRFVIFEPMYKQAGVGAAKDAQGSSYFTTNFVADGLNLACNARGKVVTYPFDLQQRVQRNFFSDSEIPDPLPEPGLNEVGYPVSVHADILAGLTVQSFTIRPRGGAPLETRLIMSSSQSAAGIVPLSVLAANTTYDVTFTGTVNYPTAFGCVALSTPVNLAWSFTTR
jgi:hypothetical protein